MYRTAQRFQSKLSLVEPPPEAENFFWLVESAHGYVAQIRLVSRMLKRCGQPPPLVALKAHTIVFAYGLLLLLALQKHFGLSSSILCKHNKEL
jgi:hypothetical protein